MRNIRGASQDGNNYNGHPAAGQTHNFQKICTFSHDRRRRFDSIELSSAQGGKWPWGLSHRIAAISVKVVARVSHPAAWPGAGAMLGLLQNSESGYWTISRLSSNLLSAPQSR
ncbi:hypothetical protein, partial [Azotobacter vinelandii]|uniref:hypothetical protein n=1 Tax=Azotobacter vinelandii TaxID=354 RepID=UPI001C31A024